jgi:hypothetical protein
LEQVKFFWEEPVDLSLIASSWEAAFKRKFAYDEWEWRFINNSYISDIYSSYITVKGLLASFYAVSPLALVTPEAEKLKTGLMVAGLTHPEFRSKRYFVQTIEELNRVLSQKGFDFIFAFANHNSHYSVRKYLNWQDIGIITNFTLNTASATSMQSNTAFSVTDLPLTGDLTEKLSHFIVCSDKYHVDRSSVYLNWRILQHPTKKYRAAGVWLGSELRAVVIYKSYNATEADLMEIFYAEESDLASEHILSALVAFLTRNGASKLNIWSNLFSDEHLCLEKLGFAEDRFSAYFGLIKLNNQSVSTQISDWHYRFLDSDVY